MPNQRYINAWMRERKLSLSPGFAENLRGLAEAYKKNAAAA